MKIVVHHDVRYWSLHTYKGFTVFVIYCIFFVTSLKLITILTLRMG